jgi:hypothetical protein
LVEAGDWPTIWTLLEILAIQWATSGNVAAASLLGFLEAHGRRVVDLADRRDAAVVVLNALPRAEGLLESGAAMSSTELIRYAQEQLSTAPRKPRPVADDPGRVRRHCRLGRNRIARPNDGFGLCVIAPYLHDCLPSTRR